MDRRQFLKTSTAGVAALGVGTAPWRSAQAQAGPIKIGLLAPLTGVVASGGKEMVEGVQFYLEQVKSEMGGRKVELTIEDDASNPDTALQKARRLVERVRDDRAVVDPCCSHSAGPYRLRAWRASRSRTSPSTR